MFNEVNNNYLGVYTRLQYYDKWINSIIYSEHFLTTVSENLTYKCDVSKVSCGCGQTDVSLVSSRIVGGTDAVEHSWPMMVSVRSRGINSHICGGTIVSESYVLTAAHCFDRGASEDTPGISVAAGMTNKDDPSQTIRFVDRLYIHPKFTNISDDYENDIALLHVNQSFQFESNSNVTKTCIHRVDPPLLSNQYPSNGTRLVVIGWGTLYSFGPSPEILQQVQVFTIDNEEEICNNSIQNPEIQFCAGLFEGGKGKCITFFSKNYIFYLSSRFLSRYDYQE